MGRTTGDARESFVSEFRGEVISETVWKNQTQESVNRVGSVLSVSCSDIELAGVCGEDAELW